MAESSVAVPTWTEVASVAPNCLLVVPVGSFEQHGPHLPLDTDTRVATALVDQVAELSFVVLAPPLAYGASGEHAGFAGTLSIGSEVLADVLVELVRSARGTCAGVVFVCAHGGNADGIRLAKERSRSEGDRVFVWGARVDGGDAHAGRTETSLMLAIAPDAVRSRELERGRIEPLDVLWPELREGGVKAVSANGVLGDPTLATAAEGRLLFGALVDELTGALESWWSELAEPAAAGASE
ncbi:MAG TPA: mycofactocin biosynthesis peptidyl-dipeptidase MftE [Acidimicrobiales bacterium]|nr:mycofactocin biosynthesis peptidyl-dipeptidase MftE [Acidimicrobiales bacterium]